MCVATCACVCMHVCDVDTAYNGVCPSKICVCVHVVCVCAYMSACMCILCMCVYAYMHVCVHIIISHTEVRMMIVGLHHFDIESVFLPKAANRESLYICYLLQSF